MTTPNQDAPDGAITIGGGSFKYSQNFDEKRVREQFEIDPPGNLREALDLFPVLLRMLPNESMRGWQKWLNKTDEDRERGLVQDALVASLEKRPFLKLMNKLWEGLTGNSTVDDKSPEDILAAANAVRGAVEDANNGLLDVITSGNNLIKNSDFERGTSRQPNQGLFSKTEAFSGERSLKMLSEGAGKSYDLLSVGLTPQSVKADPLDIFYVEVMVRGDQNNVQGVGGVDGIRLAATPLKRSGQEIQESTPGQFYRGLTASANLKSDWTKISGYIYMPAETARVCFSVQLSDAVATGEIYYFDSVIVKEVTLAKRAQDAADDAAAAANTAVDTVDDVLKAGSNVLKNPDFERGNVLSGGAFVTDPVYSGTRSLQLTGPGSAISVSYPLLNRGATPMTVQAREGDVFYLETMVSGDALNVQESGGAAGIRMTMSPVSRDGTLLPDQYVSLTASTTLNSNWYKLSGFVTMPADTVKASVSLQLRQGLVNTGEKYYFDQVVCREVTVAVEASDLAYEIISSGSNLVKNADFERGVSTQPLQGTFSDEIAAFSGTRTLRMEGGDKDYDLLSTGTTARTIQASEDDIFYVEVMVWGRYSNNQLSGGTDGVRLSIKPTDKLGAALTTQFKSLDASSALNNKWTKLSGFLTMPVGTVRAKISLQLSPAVNSSSVYYFDSVIVREVTVAKKAQDAADDAKNSTNTVVDTVDDVLKSGSNLIRNPDFERGSAQNGGTFVTAPVYSETKSLRLVGPGSSVSVVYPLLTKGTSPLTVQAREGDVFYLEAMVYGDAANVQTSGGTNGIRLVMSPVSRDGSMLADQYVSLTASTALNGAWTKMFGYATMPADSVKAGVTIQLVQNLVPSTEKYYFDQVVCREVTVAVEAKDLGEDAVATGANLIRNADFERGVSKQPAQGTFKDDVPAFTGTQSLKMVGNGTSGKDYDLISTGATPRTIPAKEGDVYYVEMMVRGGPSNVQTTGGTGAIRLTLSPTDKLGAALTNQFVALDAHTSYKNVWTKVSGFLQLPVGTTKMRVSVQLSSAVANNEVWYFDNLIVRECTVGKSAQDTADQTIDAIDQSVDSTDTTLGTGPTRARGKLRLAWANMWDGLGGTSGATDKRPSDVRTRAASVKSTADTGVTNAAAAQSTANSASSTATTANNTANTATTNIQTVVDGVAQAVDGGTATGAAASTAKTKLQAAWAAIWDGHNGSTGTASKLPSDIRTVAASVKSTADTASSTASAANSSAATAQSTANSANSAASSAQTTANTANTTANTANTTANQLSTAVTEAVDGGGSTLGTGPTTTRTKLRSAWASIWDGLGGSSGSTDKLPSDVRTRAASLKTTADTGVANAAAAQSTANSASTAASGAQSTANTASTNVQTVVDAVAQAVNGGAATGAAHATVKTNLQKAWGNIFDGMSGNAVNTTAVATPAQVHTASKAVKDTVRDTVDVIVQAVDGGSTINNTPATAKTKLQSIWNNLFDGLQGVSASGSALYPSTTYTQSSVYTGLTAANYTNMNNGVATGVDNATGTNASALEYVRADVGSSMLIDHIVIGYDYATPFLPGGFGVTYTNGAAIEGSNDGTSWTSIGTAPTYATSGSSNGLVSVNVNASYRYIRVKAATYLALTEFQVWNAVTGSTGKTLTDVKSSAATFRTDHNTLIDNISTSWLGDTVVGSTVSQALTAMQNSRKDLEENTKAIQLLRSTKNAAASKGSMYSVDFGKFSDVTSAGFTLTYSGAGASTIVVNNGVAQWSVADSSARDAKLIYGSSTATDFQCVRGVMSAPPQVPSGTTPYFYAIARVSSDGLKYVFARAYCTTFGNYKADIGYTVNGAANEVIWVTGINLTWSLDMRFTAGVGTNARQYQIWSGDKVVYTHTESGTSSALCDLGHTTPSAHTSGCVKYRQWGAIAQVRNQRVAGKVSGCSASDNGTPAVNGSTARMHRASTTAALFTANAVTALPGSFFDTIPFESQDIDADTTNGTMKVAISKPYNIVGRVALSGNVTSVCTLLLQKSTNGGSTWTTVQWGDDVYASNGEAIRGNWLQYLNAGDMVRLAYNRGGITSTILVGESTGAQTFFAITGFDLDTSIG